MANNAKIDIVGNVTRDPITRKVGNSNVTSFTVAVNTSSKGPDGNYKTNFYDVSVWGNQGEYITQKLQKGSQVWVVGDFVQDEYVGTDQKNHIALRIRAFDVRGLSRLKESTETPAAQPVATDNEMPF